ncbi:MAG: cysteine--tRNA ligase, partial [Chitinophagales bacterium]|nr:cysteine--tRNA ligase [Chitinophagales bacterium]
RSTLDFSNDSLKAAEKGLQRLMSANETLSKISFTEIENDFVAEEDAKVRELCNSTIEFMNDDLNTAMALASLFELATKIFSWQNEQLKISTIKKETFDLVKKTFSDFVNEIFGLKNEKATDDSKMNEVMQLMIALRKEAREKKDFSTSDKIRDELLKAGIQLKDGKEGTTWE